MIESNLVKALDELYAEAATLQRLRDQKVFLMQELIAAHHPHGDERGRQEIDDHVLNDLTFDHLMSAFGQG